MKKKINIKKVLIVVIIVIIAIVAFLVVRHFTSNVGHVAPKLEGKDDGMLKFENNVNGINIGARKIVKIDKNNYIMVEIENTTGEDKFNMPIGIEFVNSDGDVIYNTGYVVDVLLKDMIDNIYALITPQIADMVNEDKIDHIVIKELQ